MVATHYDVLGIAPDASTDEVRRAYLQRARAVHPDRAQPASRLASTVSMQRVNEAWHVLGDPARRAAYDQTLVGPVPTVAPAPEHQMDEVDDLDRPYTSAPAQPGDIGVSIVRALPWLVVAVILASIFVFTAFAGRDRSPEGPGDLIGKCISTGSGSTVSTVPCAGPNEGRVVLVVDRPSFCPDGSSSRSITGNLWLCLEPVAGSAP